MLRYSVRRILQMIPTVFGVILITFILFNVAGGSPAAKKLGQHVSPKALEDFDAQRGFTKPLLPLVSSRWTPTRAYAHTSFQRSAGPWQKVPGAIHTNALVRQKSVRLSLGAIGALSAARKDAPVGCVSLPAPGTYEIPLNYTLDPKATYRWEMKYRLRGTDSAVFLCGTTQSTAVAGTELPRSEKSAEAVLPFSSGENPSALSCAFRVEKGQLEITEFRLKRKAESVWDSQLVFYFRQLSRLDLGTSHDTNQRVARMLGDGLLPSLSVTVPIFLIDLVLSIVFALICAFYRDMVVDRFVVVASVVLMSVNYVVWIIAGQYLLGYQMRLFPVWGYDSWRCLVLPWIIGSFSGLGASVRFYRTIMLDEVYKDYVRTAFAKGVGKRGVLFKHVLKNAMIPILTSVVLAIPFLYTGSLLLESFFGIPGLGGLSINALNASDVDVIRAVVLIGSILYVIANLITDLCYALVDPRVRLQ